jgi:hypothetical protein
MLFETMIIVGSFASAEDRPTRDVYVHGTVARLVPDSRHPYANCETMPMYFVGSPDSLIEAVASHPTPIPSDWAFDMAFREINLQPEVGYQLLSKATEVLVSESFPPTYVSPFLTRDVDEDRSLLTVRLYVDADFAKSLELDSLLTQRLVKLFDRLPEQLSFAVYDRDDVSA